MKDVDILITYCTQVIDVLYTHFCYNKLENKVTTNK